MKLQTKPQLQWTANEYKPLSESNMRKYDAINYRTTIQHLYLSGMTKWYHRHPYKSKMTKTYTMATARIQYNEKL